MDLKERTGNNGKQRINQKIEKRTRRARRKKLWKLNFLSLAKKIVRLLATISLIC